MVRREQFVNDARTTLSASMTDSTTTATVTAGSVFPADGDFRILINSELMLVTARSGNNLTVTREIENTTAAAHSDTDTVHAILTAGGLQDYTKENTWHGNTSPALRIYNLSSGAPAVVSDFTWVNQGSATATDRDGRIVLNSPTSASVNLRGLYQTAPTAPYEIILAVHAIGERANFGQFGLFFREDSSSKLMSISRVFNGQIEIPKYTDATTFDSLLGSSVNWDFGQSVKWFKIENDDTDLKFFVGPNGQDWIEFGSEGKGVHFTTAPDQVGFHTDPDGSNSYDIMLEVFHFGEV